MLQVRVLSLRPKQNEQGVSLLFLFSSNEKDDQLLRFTMAGFLHHNTSCLVDDKDGNVCIPPPVFTKFNFSFIFVSICDIIVHSYFIYRGISR